MVFTFKKFLSPASTIMRGLLDVKVLFLVAAIFGSTLSYHLLDGLIYYILVAATTAEVGQAVAPVQAFGKSGSAKICIEFC